MGLSECSGVIKCILVFVNLIFSVFGVITVGLAIWMLTDQTFLISLSQDQSNYHYGLYICLVAGILIFILSFLGCYGAYYESTCMIMSFVSLTLIVIVAQVATGAWHYINREQLEELVKYSVHSSIKNDYSIIDSKTIIVDNFQQNLYCCGAHGPNDWAGSRYSNKDNKSELLLTVSQGTSFTVPKSCCKDKSSTECEQSLTMTVSHVIPPAIFNIGCTDQVIKEISRQTGIFFGIIIGLGVLELLALILSLVLYCTINSNPYRK